MKRAIIVLCSLIVIFIAILTFQLVDFGKDTNGDTLDNEGEYYNIENSVENGDSLYNKELIKVDTNPDSYTMIVNRDYPMPKEYVPSDLVVPEVEFSFYGTYEKSYMRKAVADAIEKMFDGAKSEGYVLKVVSAYRSYERQEAIYNNNIRKKGKESTDAVSATPGCSEHQTGLCADVSSDSVGCTIEQDFGDSPEGKWLAQNSYKYGFIIRYPEGKSDITGYSYEPWHIRYVGNNLAKYLYDKNITLEEYYKTTTVDNKVPEDEQISDTDTGSDLPDEPQMTTAPTPKSTDYMNDYADSDSEATDKPTDKPTAEPTAEPKKSPKPSKDKKPKPTKKPKVTKKPAKTKEPVVTEKPARTKEPAETAKPEKTPEPVETKEPAKDTGQEESQESIKQ